MWGVGMATATLSLQVEDPALSGNWTTLWSRTGDAGNTCFPTPGIYYDPTGAQIRYRVVGATGTAATSDIAIDDFCLVEATCLPPAATAFIVNDCSINSFTVVVDLTSLGDASSVDIVPSTGSPITLTVTVPGTHVLGPFTIGSSVSVSITHNDDASCSIPLRAASPPRPSA